MTRHALALLIGLVFVLLAWLIGFEDSTSALHYILAARGIEGPWAVIFCILGAMVVYGSLRPKRSCRQIGLALGILMLAALFGHVLKAHWLGVSTIWILPLGGAVLFALLADVSRASQRRSC